MSTLADSISRGDLPAALAAAMAAVKAAPTDADARWVLAEVLLVNGDAARADVMLDAAALGEPNPAVLEFRRLLRAEVVRGQVWREGRAPKFQGDDATPSQQAALRARVCARLGDEAGAQAAAEQAETLRTAVRGRLQRNDGPAVEFADLRDGDDFVSGELEVLTTAGDHIFVPLERVRSLEFDAPRRTRDLVWRRCTIDLKDNTEGVVYAPVLYVSPQPETDASLLLGRATDWAGPQDGPVRGRGQRVWFAGEEEVPFLSVASVVFE